MRHHKYILAIVLLLGLAPAQAVRIEITRGQVAPTPIAVTDFVTSDGSTVGMDMARVIGEDLEASALFMLIGRAAFIQDVHSLHQDGPRFRDWSVLNAQCLLVGGVHAEGSKLRVEFRLFDVFSGKQLLGVSLSAERSQWRKLAHMVADAVYKRVTGEEGYFNTKICYVDETGPRGRRKKRLCMMDWDGHNNEVLTNGHHLVRTPRFAPNNNMIAFLAFMNRTAQVYVMDLKSKAKRLLGKFDGLTFAPRFSPDGDKVVMSLAKNGTTAIYTMDLKSNHLTALTQHISIDTSPCYSPDGSQIVFTSDRDGGLVEQIYVMDKNGGNTRRISFKEGNYSQPVWSPRGDLLAFTKSIKGRFYIGVMTPDGADERLIAEGQLVESACWSPNGRVLLFTREAGPRASALYTVDITGRNLRKLKTLRDASDGAWSQLVSKVN